MEPGQSGNAESNPTKPLRKDKAAETENEEAEINPAKLDREQTEPDQEGNENSKSHEPYELKKAVPGKLMGQGGYGTSGTNGTNSGDHQN